MKIVLKNLSLLLAAALLVPIAHAQTAPAAAAAPKPAASPSQSLLDAWNDIGRKLIAMAEDFPEDKYDFKPNPAQRSFSEQVLHAAGANYFFINLVNFKTKADVVAYAKKAFADGAALIKSKGDSGLGELFADPFTSQQARFSDLAWGMIEHSGEHYGQLVVYYRVSGLVPPESRPKK